MTDNEIVKDLKSAAEWFRGHGKNTNTAIIGICERAADLINRQKTEIERLSKCNKRQRTTIKAYHIEQIKTEAIKEVCNEISAELTERATFDYYHGYLTVALSDITHTIDTQKNKKYCTECKYFVGCECFSGEICDLFTESEEQKND